MFSKMTRFALIAFITAFIINHALARIGDTPEQLHELYGAPIKGSVDSNGYGLRIYRTGEFKEIRVTFVKGKSQLEKYKIADDGPDPDSIVKTLKQDNPGESVLAL